MNVGFIPDPFRPSFSSKRGLSATVTSMARRISPPSSMTIRLFEFAEGMLNELVTDDVERQDETSHLPITPNNSISEPRGLPAHYARIPKARTSAYPPIARYTNHL